jgi:hypothetical protein
METKKKIIWVLLTVIPLPTFFIVFTLLRVSTEYTIFGSILTWIATYFFWIGQYFWIEVEPNHGVVLQDYFKKESAAKKNQSGDSTIIGNSVDGKIPHIPNGQRPVFSGLNMKLPWEFMVSAPISMVRETECQGTISVQGSDKFRYSVTYKCPLTPVRSEFLPRFLMIEEKTAIAFFKSHVEGAIRKMFAENGGDLICADYTKYSEKYLSGLFGGEEIDPNENYYGRFTNTPFLVDVKVEESGQKAAEIGEKAKKLAVAVQELTTMGLSPNVAAALLEGKDIELIDIGGNLDPKVAAAFAARNSNNKKGDK